MGRAPRAAQLRAAKLVHLEFLDLSAPDQTLDSSTRIADGSLLDAGIEDPQGLGVPLDRSCRKVSTSSNCCSIRGAPTTTTRSPLTVIDISPRTARYATICGRFAAQPNAARRETICRVQAVCALAASLARPAIVAQATHLGALTTSTFEPAALDSVGFLRAASRGSRCSATALAWSMRVLEQRGRDTPATWHPYSPRSFPSTRSDAALALTTRGPPAVESSTRTAHLARRVAAQKQPAAPICSVVTRGRRLLSESNARARGVVRWSRDARARLPLH